MDRIEIYRGRLRGGAWRWRWVAANNRRMATGGEAYHNLSDLFEALGRVTGLPTDDLERWHAEAPHQAKFGLRPSYDRAVIVVFK